MTSHASASALPVPSFLKWLRPVAVRSGYPLRILVALAVAIALAVPVSSSAQITLLDTFDPTEIGDICSIAVDTQAGDLFVYACFNDNIHRYSPDGTLLGTMPRPGESANDVDLHIAPEALTIHSTTVPRGSLLFLNGESGPAEIYALDPVNGTILDTLATDFGNGSIVGGAFSPIRDTFFLINFSGDIIGEIDPSTGATLNTVDVTEHVDVFYGDLEVAATSGNLFIVSNADAGLFAFGPDGTFGGNFPVPAGVGGLSGIALDCERNEAYVSERFQLIHHLGQVPCDTLISGDQITVTEPPDVDATADGIVPLQATLPVGFNATTREICYRRTGEAEYTCTSMQPVGDALEGAIPASFVTARGVQYFYRFSDGATTTTVPESASNGSPFVLPVRVRGLLAGGAFTPDTYRMISVPLDLLDSSFTGVLDEYGPFDSSRWRLLRWDPALELYAAHPNLTGVFTPCDAYWLVTAVGGAFETGEGASVNPIEPCLVALLPGWNQFGSPYTFPVAWSDVDFDGILGEPVLFDMSTGEEDPYIYNVEVLEPWQGYWVFNPAQQSVVMSFNPVEATASPGKDQSGRRLAGDDFEIRLSAALPATGLADTQNYLGLSARAAEGFDELDFAEAPPIGDHVRLSILENDRRLAGSFRPAGDSGQAWDMQISGDLDGMPATGIVRVAIDEFGRRPDGFDLRVVDLDAGLPVRLDDDGFEVELTPRHPERNLRLIVGTDAFSQEAGKSIPEVPQRAELAQNYPNPFNPSTRIRYQVHVEGPIEIAVFDPLGRRVRTLVDDVLEPGWYDTVWNGRDKTGTAVSSGLYFYVLKTTDGTDSRTMVLLR